MMRIAKIENHLQLILEPSDEVEMIVLKRFQEAVKRGQKINITDHVEGIALSVDVD